MRKIAANYIITNVDAPLKNGVLVTDDNGVIKQVVDTNGNLKEREGVEFYNGVLVPGFVNAHCHLELSHMHNKVQEKTGIIEFVRQINENRTNDENLIKLAVKKQDDLMRRNGIVAVGDIANTEITLQTKLKSSIYYHTFVEVFGFSPQKSDSAFGNGLTVYDEYIRHKLATSIVPHSPYSVSQSLFYKVTEHARCNKGILSMHNQESEGENQMYEQGTGAMLEHVSRNIKADITNWEATGKSSLQSVIQYFPPERPLLLVHNVTTTRSDINAIKKLRLLENTYFVLCPKSNLYIENRLPPVDLLMQENLQICLGTDSLASNHSLSMIDEMQAIQRKFASATLPAMVQWATFNGSRALSIDEKYGSFEPGKQPGINLLTDVDLQNLKITDKTAVKRII